MNRRGFLKGAAGLLSLPIVGKMASSVKSPMVREGIANVANVVSEAPVYFWKLVDKIRNLGKDVTETASTLDTQKVKQYKDYELTEDLTTGQIEIQRLGKSSDDAYVNEQASEDVFMTYRPSEKILLDEANPAGGVQKTMPEYEEFTAYVSNNRGNTGEILEEVSGVPDDIFLEVGEQVPEFLRKGKADGGIIDLAGGGRVGMFKGGIFKGIKGIRGLDQKLLKQYKDEGMEFMDAVMKSTNDASSMRYEAKMKRLDELFKETNVFDEDYVDLLDAKISLEDPEFYKEFKNFPETLKNKSRSRIDPDWAEANFGEEYYDVLDRSRVSEINKSIDPNITERSMVDDIDDMNTANIDDFFGRKKNANGGRVELAKGGIPRALQAALKALKSKFGDDIIKSGDEIESQSKSFDDFQTRNPDPNRQMTPDELEDFEMEIGADQLEGYNFDGTIGDAQRILKEDKAYEAEMYQQYKMGKLDPEAGDKSPARKRFLEQKLADMEASGDSRLMTRDEIEELSTFDLGTQMDQMKEIEINKIKQGDEITSENFGSSQFAPKKGKIIDNTSVNREIKRSVAEILSDTSPAALQKSIEIDNLMLKYPGMDRALAEQIATEINPRKKADIIAMVEQTIEMGNKGMSGDDIIQTFKNTPRTKQASGGIIGLTSNPRSASNKAGVETLFKRR